MTPDPVPSAAGPRTETAVIPTGLSFTYVTPSRVRVEAAVRNAGDRPAEATALRLSAAPLGAFVPWRPLATLTVPPLGPGEVTRRGWDATRSPVKPLGPPDRVTPKQLLTALGLEEGRPRDERPGRPQPRRFLGGGPRILASRALPAAPADLLGRPNPNWAGSLNVSVGGRDVERLHAPGLRVHPGRTNMAYFVVGSGPDAYRFRLAGDAAGWGAAVYDVTAGANLLPDPSGVGTLPVDSWVEAPSAWLIVLTFRPPEGCDGGSLTVHVGQRSTGREAVVEFGLDPAAAGPGCPVI
jgi:hypothetical protein